MQKKKATTEEKRNKKKATMHDGRQQPQRHTTSFRLAFRLPVVLSPLFCRLKKIQLLELYRQLSGLCRSIAVAGI